jgi:hypothetical protein
MLNGKRHRPSAAALAGMSHLLVEHMFAPLAGRCHTLARTHHRAGQCAVILLYCGERRHSGQLGQIAATPDLRA